MYLVWWCYQAFMVVFDMYFFLQLTKTSFAHMGNTSCLWIHFEHPKNIFNLISESFSIFAHAVVKMRWGMLTIPKTIHTSYLVVSKCQFTQRSDRDGEREWNRDENRLRAAAYVLCWYSTAKGSIWVLGFLLLMLRFRWVTSVRAQTHTHDFRTHAHTLSSCKL